MNEIIKIFIGLLYFFSVTLSAQSLMVYEDKTAKRSVEEVLHGEDTQFAAGDGSVGLSDSVWWVKIPLYNDQNVSKRVFVVFPNPLTRSLRVYIPTPSGLQMMQSGYAVPVSLSAGRVDRLSEFDAEAAASLVRRVLERDQGCVR